MELSSFDDSYEFVSIDKACKLLKKATIEKTQEVIHEGRIYRLIDARKNKKGLFSKISSPGRAGTVKFYVEITPVEYLQSVLVKGGIAELTDSDDPLKYKWEPGWVDRVERMLLPQMIYIARRRGTLAKEIFARREEIRDRREEFRGKILKDRGFDSSNDVTRKSVEALKDIGILESVVGGQGGAYFLKDPHGGETKFVLKPNNEDLLTLHNSKRFATPFIGPGMRVRSDIPSYQSAMNEALTSDIAEMVGLRDVVPRTVLVIVDSQKFHNIVDVFPGELRQIVNEDGINDLEKLCSAQEFVPNSRELYEETEEAVDEEREITFDQVDFEDVNILCWITGEQDGNDGNFRVYRKNPASSELGIKKIDSGLTFGEGTRKTLGLVNGLAAFEKNMNKPLSKEGRAKIMDFPLERVIDRMRFYGKSEASIARLSERVALLQELAGRDGVTLGEMNEAIKVAMKKLHEE